MKKIVTAFLVLICLTGLATETNAFQDKGDALSGEVDNIIKLVESAKIIGTKNERQQLFFSLLNEIDRLEKRIDWLEDKAKADYAAGNYSWDEYRSVERRLEVLENRLDRAEKRLNKKFGIRD